MVSAPATYWTSVHWRPASFRASPAAARPYSTKLRPHLPQGCMPAPRTAIRLSSGMCASLAVDRLRVDGLPLPDHVLVLVVLVQRVEHDLDLSANGEVVDGHAGDHLAHDHHLLVGQLHGGDGEGHVGGGGHVGLGGLVAGVGVGPDLAPTAEGRLGELGALALGVPTEIGLPGEG